MKGRKGLHAEMPTWRLPRTELLGEVVSDHGPGGSSQRPRSCRRSARKGSPPPREERHDELDVWREVAPRPGVGRPGPRPRRPQVLDDRVLSSSIFLPLARSTAAPTAVWRKWGRGVLTSARYLAAILEASS